MLRTLGLLALGAEFFNGGLGQTKRAEHHVKQAEQAGLPVKPEFIRACGWTMVGASVALQIPFLRRPAALLLAAMLVPITYIGHPFWKMEDAGERRRHETNFLKNVSMFGGALFVAGSG